jgi:hypothetical protein
MLGDEKLNCRPMHWEQGTQTSAIMSTERHIDHPGPRVQPVKKFIFIGLHLTVAIPLAAQLLIPVWINKYVEVCR